MSRFWLFIAPIAVLVLWICWLLQSYFAPRLGITTWELQSAGQLGDSFGPLNALFSALGFLAILFTLNQQMVALSSQQEQIGADRALQYRERFERTFLDLLALLREEREQLQFKYSDEYLRSSDAMQKGRTDKIHKGRKAIRAAVYEMRYWIASASNPDKQVVAHIYDERVSRRYLSFFGPYNRIIYSILRKVDADTGLDPEEKVEYSRLLRSQLTHFEATLAGISGLADHSKEQFRLLQFYKMLKYIPRGKLRAVLEGFYGKEAFQGRSGTVHEARDVDDDEEAPVQPMAQAAAAMA